MLGFSISILHESDVGMKFNFWHIKINKKRSWWFLNYYSYNLSYKLVFRAVLDSKIRIGYSEYITSIGYKDWSTNTLIEYELKLGSIRLYCTNHPLNYKQEWRNEAFPASKAHRNITNQYNCTWGLKSNNFR